jgi:integration host factor subunit beta
MPECDYQSVPERSLTKRALVEEVARAAGLTKKDAESVLDTVLGGIVESLRRGEKVELRGFGSFRVRQRGPHTGRNPKTGERVDVPSRRVPHFKPGKELKALINGKLPQVGGAATAGASCGTQS